ncbi:cilia-and flagella-associated protein 57 [Caerostris darwini]|uniref:Cilia-and flagella-associated protein 57 n=1 Tax=Caerostris darwini TaxID=1538125 RepID=A0AAV4R0B6_9ARAC|nr:cilia-and flagella-associated protein 57 [Caerostris darwini]
MTKDNGNVLKLSAIFGFQQAVRGGLGFSGPNTLFHLAGRMGVHYKLKAKYQQFTPLPEENEVTAVGFGANNVLILATKGKKASIVIFDPKTNQKRNLKRPEKIVSNHYVWVSFSEDCDRVGGQGGAPDWAFALWHMEKKRLEAVIHPFRMEPNAKVYKFGFCPFDSSRIFVVGRYFLRLYRCKDEQRMIEIALHDHERTERTFHCVAWMRSPDRAMIGTSDGNILIFQNITLLREVSVTKELTRIQRSVNVEDKNVTCILLTSDGLMCSHGTTSVLCFKEDFKLHKVLNIPQSSRESRVVQLAMNLQESIFTVATRDGRIMYYSLAFRSDEKDCEDDFRVVQDYQHTRAVICADTIRSVSLQVACSDTTITIRDFSSR